MDPKPGELLKRICSLDGQSKPLHISFHSPRLLESYGSNGAPISHHIIVCEKAKLKMLLRPMRPHHRNLCPAAAAAIIVPPTRRCWPTKKRAKILAAAQSFCWRKIQRRKGVNGGKKEKKNNVKWFIYANCQWVFALQKIDEPWGPAAFNRIACQLSDRPLSWHRRSHDVQLSL